MNHRDHRDHHQQGHHPHQRGDYHSHHENHHPPPEKPAQEVRPAEPARWHSFKLIVDPTIHRDQEKMVRFDGTIVPGDPHYLPPFCSDPRKRPHGLSALWKQEALELPVPRFTIDEFYIGDPPPVEVTVDNLNDNIDKQFLHNMVVKYGELEDLEIDYHPLNKKHLGLARLIFKAVRSARECVSALHGKSVMGKQLNCYLDPRGVMAAKMFQDLTTDRKPSPPPPPPPDLEPAQEEEEPPPPEDNYRQEENWEGGRGWDWEETRDSWARERDYEYSGRHDKRDKRGRDRYRRNDNDMYDHHSSRDADNSHSHDTGHYNDYYNNSSVAQKYSGQDQGQEYWNQQGGSYAGGGQYDKEEKGENKESGSESERHVDLDTRLKMLMKDKSGGMPAFLLGATTSDEDEKPLPPPPPPPPAVNNNRRPDDPILDRTPSPFRDRDAYIKSYWITRRQDEMTQVNCALASYNHLTMDPHKRPFSRASDKMSLSSLSPGDNKIHQEEPNYIPAPNNQYGFAPGYGFNPFPGQPYGSVPWYGDRSQQDPYSMQYGVPGPGPGGSGQFDQYSDQYNDWVNNQWNQSSEEVKESKQKKNKFQGKDPKDPYRGLIDSVVSIVEAELKATLKKDINKKMCETLAFMLFDQWWIDQEIKYKAKLITNHKHKLSAPTIHIPDRYEKVESLPRIQDLSSLIDKQRESMAGSASTFGLGGSLGLGRLGAIPKLKKTAQPIRPPSPKWENKKKHKHREKSRDDKEEDEEKFKLDREKERRERKEKKKERKDKESPKKSKDGDSKDKTTVESLYSAIYGDSDDDDEDEEVKKPKKEESSSDVSESEPEIKTKKVKSSPDNSDTSDADTSSVASSKSSSSSSSASSDSSEDDDDEKKAKKRSSSSDSSSSSSSSKSKSASVSKSRSHSKSRSRSKSRTPIRLKSKSRSLSGSSEVRISPPSTPTTRPTTPKLKSPVQKEKSVSPVPSPKKISPEKTKSEVVVDGSSTETDNETEETKVGQSTAAHALMALSSSKLAEISSSSPIVIPPSPVKVQYLEDAASPPHIMDHCYAKPVARRERKETQSSVSEQENQQQQRSYSNEHDYARPSSPSPAITEAAPPTPPAKATSLAKRGRKPGHGYTRPQLPVQPVKFKPREIRDQYGILYKFLTDGIDNEDIAFLKRSYDMMLLDNQPNLAWINDTHWVDHPSTGTSAPPKKKRRNDDFSKDHKSGSARTEGYYKMDPREKARTKYHFHRTGVDAFSTERKDMDKQGKQQKAISASREARSQQRRMLTALGNDAIESDLLKFNQLKFRRKAMKFGKSAIHDWGLFALEAIGEDEMVIEYVGAVVRPLLSDIREKRYEKQGIGSSYLFRIDLEYVVDATKCGNLARFVNHSCDPNCYAKIIKIDGQSKIVIYSKQPIALGEEITYDYKFPIEDEKIRCLCASKNCRKYLN